MYHLCHVMYRNSSREFKEPPPRSQRYAGKGMARVRLPCGHLPRHTWFPHRIFVMRCDVKQTLRVSLQNDSIYERDIICNLCTIN
jgi:hypothetical protein